MVKREWNKPRNRNLWQQLSKPEYLHLSFRNLQQVEWVIPGCRNAFGMCSYWHPCTTCLGSAVPWALAFAETCVRGKCQLPSDVSVCRYKSHACTSRARVRAGETHARKRGLCDSCSKEAGICILAFPPSKAIMWWMNSRFHACGMRLILY